MTRYVGPFSVEGSVWTDSEVQYGARVPSMFCEPCGDEIINATTAAMVWRQPPRAYYVAHVSVVCARCLPRFVALGWRSMPLRQALTASLERMAVYEVLEAQMNAQTKPAET